jgi:hypothetical protein
MTEYKRWWQQDDHEFESRAAGLLSGMRAEAERRKGRYLRSLRMYENRDFQSLEEAQIYVRDVPSLAEMEFDGCILRHNLVRSACDTVHAELCGRQKPKPQFATTDGSWKSRRRMKRLDRATEAVLRSAHGHYASGWDLAEDVLLDAIVLGTGVGKVVPDIAGERILYERTMPWTVMVDSNEGQKGSLLTVGQCYPMDVAVALDMFPGAAEEAIIMSAKPPRMVVEATGELWQRNSETIEIDEIWRVGNGTTDMGAHAFLCGGKLLHREEWDSELPFWFLHWARPRVGFWGISLVEEAERMQIAYDEDVAKLDERIRKCSGMRTWVPRGANIKTEDLTSNDTGIAIEYDGAQPPMTEVPSPVSPSEVQYHQMQRQQFFEDLGVSLQRASSRKDPGVTSGVAIRAENDIQTVRFAVKAKYYENSYTTIGRITAFALRLLHEGSDSSAGVTWRDGARMMKYVWQDIDVSPRQIVCSVAPASALGNDQAGRLQMLQDLPQLGINLPQDTIMRLLGWVDLERELGLASAERDHIEMTVDALLDAASEDDDALIVDPDPLIANKDAYLGHVAESYHAALVGGAPEYVLTALRELISKLIPPPPPPSPPPTPTEGAISPPAPQLGAAPSPVPPAGAPVMAPPA